MEYGCICRDICRSTRFSFQRHQLLKEREEKEKEKEKREERRRMKREERERVRKRQREKGKERETCFFDLKQKPKNRHDGGTLCT